MQSKPLILDEWVIHDLRGDNGEERQKETFQFLEQVDTKCDHLVLLRRSPWMAKAHKLMKESEPKLRLISRFLHLTFIRNSLKNTTLNANEIPALPQELQMLISPKDSYLIALNKAVPESIIVTTDVDLVQALSDLPNMTIRVRNEFVENYSESKNT